MTNNDPFTQIADLIETNTELKEFFEGIRAAMEQRFDSSTTVSDLDAVDKSGFYNHSPAASNRPLDGYDGRVLHIATEGGEWSQLDVIGGNTIAFRDRDNGAAAPTPWRFGWFGQRPSQQVAESGYQVMPSGLILQWGRATGLDGTQVEFPLEFPNAAFSVTCTENEHDKFIGAGNLTATGFIAKMGNADGTPRNSGNNSAFYWMAVGH